MSLLSRLFGKRADDRAEVRALWHRIVALARKPQWYADLGVADTLAGRFDAVTLVLSLVLLRMERDDKLIEPSVRLTELFVEDMDGQLRQSGVGDLGVGKKMGKLMGVLGGRLGALREALPQGEAALAAVIARNVTLLDGTDPAPLARAALALASELDTLDGAALLGAEFGV
jgi:cytochrome b pre-mRNA-processing protein 3